MTKRFFQYPTLIVDNIFNTQINQCYFLLPYYPHISPPAYKHMYLYPGHMHMRLYSVDIHQTVTKLIRSKITVIPLLLSQITVPPGDICHYIAIFVSMSVWSTKLRAKFTQIIKIWETKFTNICLIWMAHHTVASF